jgi:hypothetical protein
MIAFKSKISWDKTFKAYVNNYCKQTCLESIYHFFNLLIIKYIIQNLKYENNIILLCISNNNRIDNIFKSTTYTRTLYNLRY